MHFQEILISHRIQSGCAGLPLSTLPVPAHTQQGSGSVLLLSPLCGWEPEHREVRCLVKVTQQLRPEPPACPGFAARQVGLLEPRQQVLKPRWPAALSEGSGAEFPSEARPPADAAIKPENQPAARSSSETRPG